MNSIQKYVLNSLFERNQITEEKLAQALDTFSNGPAIDSFLSVLITGQEETEELEEYSPKWRLNYYKQFKIQWNFFNFSKIQFISVIKEVFKTDLKTAKDIVDTAEEDMVIIPKNISISCCTSKKRERDIISELEKRNVHVEVETKLH